MGRRIAVSFVLLVSTFAGLLSPAVVSAQSAGDGLQGNTYTDPVYGFTVEWDAGTFDAEEMLGEDNSPYGVYLTSEEVTASVAAGGYGDLQECLDDRVALLREIDGVSRLREARRLDPLEFDRDVLGGVYQYTYDNPDTGDSGTFATYFGCEPLMMDGEPQPDVVLTHDFGAPLDSFEALSSEWLPVINGIQFAGDERGTSDRDGQNDDNDGAVGGLSGNRYIDPVFLFSVTWDADIYEAEEIRGEEAVPYGVSLTSDSVLGSIFGSPYATQRACINGEADSFETIDGVTDVAEADDLDLPDSDPDARVGLYRYTYESPSSGNTIDFVQYIECRDIIVDGEPVDDVFLVIEFGVPEAIYADTIPALEDILAAIELDVPLDATDDSGDDNGSNQGDKPGVTGNSYLDPTDGWAVSWDDAVLTGSNWEAQDTGDILGVQLASEAGNFMTIVGGNARSLRACVNDQVVALEGSAFSDFEEIDSEDLPETGDDARAILYQGIFTSDAGDQSDIYLYVECRPMIVDGEEVEDRFLIVNAFSAPDTYSDELAAWSDVLTSVAFDAGAGRTSDQPTDDRTPGADVDEPGIAGNTYTSSIGYQLSWDASVYEPSLLDESNPDLGLNLSSAGAFMTFQVAGDPTAESCVEAEAGVVEGLNGMSSLSTSREDSPQAATDSASQLYEGVLTFDSGAESEVVVYIECRPLGDIEDATLFLVIRMVGVTDAYADELPLWQEIIDSIRFISLETDARLG